MRFSAVTILALAVSTFAAPTETPKTTFSVKQVKNEQHVPNGPLAMAKTLKKFGKEVPQNIKDAIARHRLAARAGTETGTVTATPEDAFDSEYLAPVSIGTPAQVLNLDFDTGSSDLWVFSSETPTSERDGQTIYTSSKSSTAKTVSGATWSIEYGDGSSSSGNVVTDVVTIGGATVTGQSVELAEKVSDEFVSDSANDGILGLAFDSINTVRPTAAKTFFFNALNSLESPVFTANLEFHAAGTYDFGFIDTTKFTGTITYAAVNTENGFWEITGSGYAIGSAAFKTLSIDAIVDTGTTLLYVPVAVSNAYWATVSSAQNSEEEGGWIFDCSATLPEFTFGIGSSRFVIPGDFMNYAPVEGSTCFGGIQANTGIGFSIFGDILIKSSFVVFDGGATRVGFAAKTVS